MVLGLAYMVIVPPFEAPDEPAHFLRAWSVAEAQWVVRDHPDDVVTFILEEMSKRHEIEANPLFKDMLRITDSGDPRVPNLAFNTSLYSPIPYIFHAGAIKVLKGSVTLDQIFYACRLVSLLIFTCSVFFIFSRLGSWSWPVFWIACTPMALSQASVISTDGILFSAVGIMVVTAIFPRGKADYAIVFLSIFFIGLTKSTYIVLAIFPFLSVYYNKALRFPFFVGLAVTVFCIIAWQFILEKNNIIEHSIEFIRMYTFRDVDPRAQLSMIINNPAGFMAVLWSSIIYEISGHMKQFIGVLGWLHIFIPGWIYAAWLMIACLSMFSLEKSEVIKDHFYLYTGLWGLAVGFMTCIGIFFSLYLIWMPVGASSIEIQGRYLHAPALAAALCMGMLLPEIKKVKHVSIWIFPFMALAINFTALYTVQSYYQ